MLVMTAASTSPGLALRGKSMSASRKLAAITPIPPTAFWTGVLVLDSYISSAIALAIMQLYNISRETHTENLRIIAAKNQAAEAADIVP